MTAALEGGEWSAARSGRTLSPGMTRYPFYRRLDGPQGRSGWAENHLPTGIRSWTVQPVVSRYTDWSPWPTFRNIASTNSPLPPSRPPFFFWRLLSWASLDVLNILLSFFFPNCLYVAVGYTSSTIRRCLNFDDGLSQREHLDCRISLNSRWILCRKTHSICTFCYTYCYVSDGFCSCMSDCSRK
jgi:hypothetical protein